MKLHDLPRDQWVGKCVRFATDDVMWKELGFTNENFGYFGFITEVKCLNEHPDDLFIFVTWNDTKKSSYSINFGIGKDLVILEEI